LQLERKKIRPAQFQKPALGVLLVLILFASLLLAVSQSLHAKLHQDAGKPSHQCAITLFAEQQVLASEPKIDFIEPDFEFILLVATADSQIFFGNDYRISASRAPPFTLSLAIIG
jgi:hypothetical protein